MRSSRRSRRSAFENLEARRLFAAHIVGSTVSYSTIQAAVNAASAGATINVDAGTYNETVTINKSLTLRGAEAGVDARNSRGSETIVYATKTVIDIQTNDVTIDGFTIEGNDSDIGAQLGAGVLMEPSIHGTHVLNNIIQNNVTGIYLSNNSNTDMCVIQHNIIQDNFEANNYWTKTPGENGSREIYTDGTVSGDYLTNVLIDSNIISNKNNYNGGDEDEGLIALQALGANKQFNIAITNNTMSYGSKALLATNVTNLVFMGNTITNFNDGSSGPVRFEGNDNVVDIQYNTIDNNAGPGIAADSSGVAGDSSGFVVNNNNIYSNDGIGVLTIASVYNGPLIAVGDWWGSASGPSGDGPGTGQAVWANGNSGHGVHPTGAAGGTVTFSPWATALINIASIPVAATPSNLAASATSTSQIQLSWTAPMSTAVDQLIQRSTDGVNFTTIATVPALLTSYSDTNLSGGTKYYYRIIASNFTGNSAPSGVASATTGGSVGGGSVALSSLNWSSATTGYGSVQKNQSVAGNTLTLNGVGYATGIGTHAASTIVYNLAGQYTNFASDAGIDSEEDGRGTGEVDFKVIGDGKTLFDSGVLTNDQVAHINVSVAGVQTLQLVATNGISNNIDYDHADWAGATLSSSATSVPSAPTGVAAAALSASSIKISWAATSGAASYSLDRSTDGASFTTVATGITATSYTDGSLGSNTTYYYRIRAVNSAGSSGNSSVVN
ncbi:MAG: NPCBM/NEW2 domain-containing protein, partial [Phycisphaerae bacterium]|nr:NPCBM/NEW2 domain-containing protein [Phycisphaerae bacterium]